MMKTTLTDGNPVPEDGSHKELKPNGQQKGYVVLSDEERAKGFVESFRDTYTHLTCGAETIMSHAIAATYATNPYFYSGTFCTNCGKHFPIGENGEFVWTGTDQKVGTRNDTV
jgi:hypothetical protein